MSVVPDGTDPAPVYFASVQEPLQQMNGSVRPQRLTAQLQDSCIIQIDSGNRKTGTDYDYVVDLLQSNASFRQTKLIKAILPLVPQINEANNKMVVRLAGHPNQIINLPNGYYNPQSLVNTLTDEMGDAWVALSETLQVNYDAKTRKITLDSSVAFGILDTSPFARFALSVCEFPTVSASDALSTLIVTSTSLGMVFTRFITIESQEMLRNNRGPNLIAGRGARNVIGVADVIEKYNTSQWNPSEVFPGTTATFDITISPKFTFQQALSTPRVVDIQIRDQYGFTLDRIGAISYATTLWFEVYL
jgi:hypothetical protein